MIILSEILWYILDDIKDIIYSFKKTFKGRYVLINQSFYFDKDQKYGREYFTNPEEVIKLFDMKCINLVTAYSSLLNSYEAHIALKVD